MSLLDHGYEADVDELFDVASFWAACSFALERCCLCDLRFQSHGRQASCKVHRLVVRDGGVASVSMSCYPNPAAGMTPDRYE